MEDSKIKNIVDKILIGIFTILCVVGFIMVACELPNFLNEIFNTTAFENTTTLSFFACLALLGYVMKHYEDEKHEKDFQISMKHIDDLIGLNNVWKLKECYTQTISLIEITRTYNVAITINEEYSIELSTGLFSNIKTEGDLTKLDIFISTLLKDSEDESGDDMDLILQKMRLFEMKLKDKIEEYLINYKSDSEK